MTPTPSPPGPRWRRLVSLCALAACVLAGPAPADDVLAPENIAAWCIVPFDARHRGPEDRAQMLERLGIHQLAYDWRDEHIPQFDAEVEAMKRHGIAITAWWFPGSLDGTGQRILDVIARYGIHPQLWVMGGGEAVADAAAQRAQVDREAARLRPIAEAAAKLGCQVGLYNHGGWFGEPENQLQILTRLEADGIKNAGIVYNFHHGHGHIARFATLWPLMQAKVIALNLNGMVPGGEENGRKILTLGTGDSELAMLRIVESSGWRGMVGIIDHLPETDSETTLTANLKGLENLRKALAKPTAAPAEKKE